MKPKKLDIIQPSKAVAYLRVSSDAQAAKLQAYAQVKEFELVDVISDPTMKEVNDLGEHVPFSTEAYDEELL